MYNIHNKNWVSVFFASFMALMLTSCSNNNDTAGIERSGTGISQGTISGFGSIFLNGVEFNTDAAVININGVEGNEDDLHVGMIATVNGVIDNSEVTGTAYDVSFNFNIIGSVESIDLNNKIVKVLEQTILFDSLTVFRFGKPDSLEVGDVIAISGLQTKDGVFVASYIEVSPLSVSNQIELSGVISDLDSNALSFRIGAQLIYYSQAVFDGITMGALSNGKNIRIVGSKNSNAIIVATNVESASLGFIGDPGVTVTLEGIVNKEISDSEFIINGTKIVSSSVTQFVNGSSIDVAENTKLKVQGIVTELGVVIAEKIEFSLSPNIEISGGVDSVNVSLGRLFVSGLSVDVNASTLMLDTSSANIRRFSLASIKIGDQVSISGKQTGSQIEAVLLNRIALAGENPSSAPVITTQGLVSDSISDPLFVMGVLTVDTSSLAVGSLLDNTFNNITRADFFATLSENMFVEASGTLSGTTLIATRVRLLNFSNYTANMSNGSALTGANDLAVTWDGSLNTTTDITNGTAVVNMFITSNQATLGGAWNVHDIRVFGPGNYSFDTCVNEIVSGGPCGTLQMTVGENQIGAHMLLDWNGLQNIDVINVWNKGGVFCADVNFQNCEIHALSADGSRIQNLEQVSWSLVSTDIDGDGIPGTFIIDSSVVGAVSPSFNLQVPVP